MERIYALLPLFLFLATLVGLTAAVDVHAAGTPSQDTEKRGLILQFFESKPPRALVDASIEAMAASRYAEGDPARDEFVSRMQLAVDYDRIEALTLETMADIFTVPELKAMVAYYTSEAGQAAETKGKVLREKIAPELKAMLDRGLLDVVTTPSPADRADSY